jgi:hypothetical protein
MRQRHRHRVARRLNTAPASSGRDMMRTEVPSSTFVNTSPVTTRGIVDTGDFDGHGQPRSVRWEHAARPSARLPARPALPRTEREWQSGLIDHDDRERAVVGWDGASKEPPTLLFEGDG